MGLPLPSPSAGSVDAATAYLESLPLEARRQTGQVFTPAHLVRFILREAGFVPSEGAPSLLDPSCGAGAFLVCAAELIVAGMKRRRIDITSPSGHARLIEHIERSMFGVDIDRQALRLAREAMANLVKRVTGIEAPRSFFAKNLFAGDFLTDRDVYSLPPLSSGGFDFIVGNPPYVSTGRLPSEYKAEIRARFATATGRIDLYTVFMEHSLSLLKRRGRFALITPDKFLTSQTSLPLRTLLLREGAVRVVARFRSHKVFVDAATVPCVTVFERMASQATVRVLDCDEQPSATGRVLILRESRADSCSLAAESWRFAAPDLQRLATSIEGAHPRLARFVTRHSAGLASGRDALYVFNRDDHTIEPELLRPTIRGRDLLAFEIRDSRLSLLVPYTFERNGRPALIDINRYPKVLAYLRQHESILRARHCVRVWQKAWYDLHDPVPTDIGRLPKILVPDVAAHNRFAYDHGMYWPLHSAYYLVPSGIDPIYLTAVLNSLPIEFLIRLRAPVVKDGFSRYRKQFLEPLPIPQGSDQQRAEVVRAVERGEIQKADRLVTRLFGISRRDADKARAFLARASNPRRPA